jgi:hypothetical protein
MIRWINISLAVAALYGGFVAVREARVKERLVEEHRILAAEVGFLDVSDPGKVHVVALASEDPLHFRWRIYLPDNYRVIWRTSELGDRKHSSTGPQNFIAQVRFRKSEYGFVRIFKDLESRGGVGSLGGRELETFLRDRWDEIETVQLGADGPAVIEPQELATLLQLRMPEAMAEEAEAFLPASWAREVVPVLYEVRIGTEEAWQDANRGNSVSGASGR